MRRQEYPEAIKKVDINKFKEFVKSLIECKD
jgi:hypothetical protein